MNPRREFFTALFAALDANGVRYCIMRNYDQLCTGTETDVDVLVSEYSSARFAKCLRDVARQTGFRFVHAARYVNYSHVFWHPQAGFIRMDFETEVRWRVFPVLSSREVLDARQLHDGFYIPHPKHESAIIWVAAVWRGFLSDRYRAQLARLYAACPDKSELRAALRGAFGSADHALAEFQSKLPTGEFNRAFCSRVRRSLVGSALRGRRRFCRLVQNVTTDGLRLVERLRRPAGFSLLFVSASAHQQNFDHLIRRIEFLFPSRRCILQTSDPTAHARWSLRSRLRRLRVLFKGGLFVRAYRLARDADLPSVVRTHARDLYLSRTFICMEDSANRFYVGQVERGFMAAAGTMENPAPDFSREFIEFLANIQERKAKLPEATGTRRGAFCVLVGLDGSGKTTLARNLCRFTIAEPRFNGVRYFHWRPKIFGRVEFPLPEFQNLPRKQPAAKNFPNSILSGARLVKNAALANLAWWFRLRPLLRRGYLVLVDRYFYNYYLDPVSVKYSGPPSWLESARRWFPKPEVIIALRAPKEILLQRKQELPESEILRQATVLENMKFGSARVVNADASQPAEQVARTTLAEILKAVS